MKLSKELHQQIESYFRLYFEDEKLKLPEVQIFVRRGAWIFSRLFAVDGVTLGRFIFIRPGLVKRNRQNRLTISKSLLVHELTHTMQYERMGFMPFLYNYFKAFFVNLKHKKRWDFRSRIESYLEIPHEIEARDAAEKFLIWFYSEASASSFSSAKSSK